MAITNHGFLTEKVRENGELEITCFCGDKWTHPKDTDFAKKQSIMESHTKYYNKILHTVL